MQTARPHRRARRRWGFFRAGSERGIRLCVLALASILLLPSPVSAQGSGARSPSAPDIRFERFSVDEGLPQSTVGAIVQDHDGFLWLATQDGLVRYDGYEFLTFRHDPDDPATIPGNDVSALLVGRSGDLWVGSDQGLSRLRNHDRSSILDLSDLRSDADSAFVLRIGFEPYELDARPTTRPGLRTQVAASGLREDDTGHVWIWSTAGLDVWDPATDSILPSSEVGLPIPARESPIPAEIESELRSIDGWDSRRVGRWLQDSKGVVWIGLADPWELLRFVPGERSVQTFRHDPTDGESLGAGEVFALIEDGSGILWVGTGRGGLNRIVEHDLTFDYLGNTPEAPDALVSNYIAGISSDATGALWVGTDVGLQRVGGSDAADERFVPRGDDPGGLSDPAVRAVLVDRRGAVWVGAGGVLHRRDEATTRFERIEPAAGEMFVDAALTEDREGWLWATFLSREEGMVLYRIDPETAQFLERHVISARIPYSLGSGPVTQTLHRALDGTVWIGTWEWGLFALDPETGVARHYLHVPGDATSLSHDIVHHVTEDRRGTLWVGTRGGGLSRYDADADAFVHYRSSDGLANDVVYGILEDDDGFLWISTNQGLSRFDPVTESFRNFDVADGLQSNEFNRYAFQKTADGELIFGGINGITRFNPSRTEPNDAPPLVALTSVSVGNRPVAVGPAASSLGELRLAHHQNLISFDYVGLHFASPRQNRYSYRLEGVEDDWVDAGTRRFVSYANLDPGEYTFRVRAANSDGVWSEQEVALAIVVLPPFWATWWFIAMVVVAAASLLFAGHRFRVATLLREEQMRTRIARDLHDDVSATLSSVAFFAEAIRSDIGGLERPRAERFLGLISGSAREARERISDIVWAISPEHQSWESLMARIRRYASDAFDSNSIRHHIVLPHTVLLKPLPPDRRNQFWLIFKELVANATRHSECTLVRIELSARGKRISFSFADDGVGFDPTGEATGEGVSNIRARAAALDAVIELETSLGRGTRWTLSFRA